jgi:acylphosphatase
MAGEAAARQLMIHGRVQGVCYRAWTVETARGLGLTGWVRNRMDGSVEAVVQGAADAVNRFILMAQDGPAAAVVTRIDVVDVAVEPLATFEKRATC